MRKLAVSYTTTLYALRYGQVSEQDLQDALIYFGCIKEHALDPNKSDLASVFKKAPSGERDRVHEIIKRVILAAEAEGRITWRPNKDSHMNYDQLNDLLAAHGYPRLITSHEWHYSLPRIRDMVEQQLGGQLEILFH
jgi:hypothetical protein